MTDQRQAAIEKLVKDENVKHIQLWFTDILGNLKMVEVPDRQLPNVIESGAAFDGSSISGYAEIEESDIVAMPDWDTFTVLPWAQGSERTAFVFCDVLDRKYKPFEGDPRWVLRRQLERAKKLGLDFYVGPELEYFYFTNSEKPELTDEGGYFDVLPADLGNDLRKQTMRTLDRLDIPMEASHHEVAPSQHEIDPHYDKALLMADRVMIIRLIVKEVAAHNGVHATFMPKPMHGQNGSGMHVHQSLFKRASRTPSSATTDPDHLSDIAKGFIAGQLKHMREFTLDPQPVRQQLQAPGPRLRGARVHQLGAPQPHRAHPRAAVRAGQGEHRPRRAAQPGPRRQPVPCLRRHARRRPRRHREGLRPAAGRRAQHLQDDRRRARGPSASARCRTTSTRRSSTRRRASWCAASSATTCSSAS